VLEQPLGSQMAKTILTGVVAGFSGPAAVADVEPALTPSRR
jgi:hypothetical protein